MARRAARIAQIKKLIDGLRAREMMRDEISNLLGNSPSGTRKYLRDLRDLGIVQIARYAEGTANFLGGAVFGLVDDEARIADFIESIERTQELPVHTGPSRSGLDKAQPDPTRHFHILQDDVAFQVRISRAPVMRDPMVTALFGAPRGQQGQVCA